MLLCFFKKDKELKEILKKFCNLNQKKKKSHHVMIGSFFA